MHNHDGPEPATGLAAEDAIELAELLDFLRTWLGSPDNSTLAASLARFVNTDGFDITDLRTDLARFVFLLGGGADKDFGIRPD